MPHDKGQSIRMDKNNFAFGVLYATAGEAHVREAEKSAASVRKLMPDIPIAIWTDRPDSLTPGLFDHVHTIEKPLFLTMDRIEPMLKTPFQKTLYLDSDTLLIEPVYELIELLDRYEFAYTHAPRRICCSQPGCGIEPSIPAWFVQPGSGVILYKNTEMVKRVLSDWMERYMAGRKKVPMNCCDQASLWRALYNSPVNMTVLPPEYNYRTVCPSFAGQNYKVKILHGRDRNLDRARRFVNLHQKSRIANYAYPRFFSDQFMPLVTRAIVNNSHLYKFLAKLNSSIFSKW